MSVVQPKILCVDDDKDLLEAMKRQLRKRFDCEVALSGALGLKMVDSHGPFEVVLSDMRMPHMSGSQFLAAMRVRAPDTSRIMLTGYSELDAAIDAVNDGHIFRFLCKPCAPDVLRTAVDAGVEQYRLRRAEHELLQKTLRGSVDALGDVLALASPAAFGRARRIQRTAVALAQTLGLESIWQVEVAALLSQLGAVTLPGDVLEGWERGMTLSADEEAMVSRFPDLAETLLQRIPRLERVREIIRKCSAPYTAECSGEAPIEAFILRFAVDLDALQVQGASTTSALLMLGNRSCYHPDVLRAARDRLATAEDGGHPVPLRMLELGMVLDQDLRDEQQGVLLAARGHLVSESLLIRLLNLGTRPGLPEFVRVLVPLSVPLVLEP